MEVKGEVAGTPGMGGIIALTDGLDRIERQAEVFKNTLAHLETAKLFAACPVEDTVEVAPLGQFEEHIRHVGGGARLADFVAKKLRALSGEDCSEEFLVHAALAAGAVAHEDGDAQHDRVFRIVLEHFSLGHEFGLPIEIGRAGHVGRAVGLRALPIKYHIA